MELHDPLFLPYPDVCHDGYRATSYLIITSLHYLQNILLKRKVPCSQQCQRGCMSSLMKPFLSESIQRQASQGFGLKKYNTLL